MDSSKIKTIKDIYDSVIPNLTLTDNNWKDFLKFSSQIWKHKFDAKILIYAQKPEATFVASMSIWNNKIHRYINKGAKSIKVFDTKKAPVEIEYLFDVSDTNGPEKTYPKVWSINDNYKKLLNKRLNDKYKINSGSLEDTIKYLCKKYSEILYKSYICEPEENNEQISISDKIYNDFNGKYVLSLQESMIYLVSKRCNLNIDAENYFKYITEFDNKKMILSLFSAVSDISQLVLWEIENETKNIINEVNKDNETSRIGIRRERRDIISEDRNRGIGRESGAIGQVWKDGNELLERSERAEVHGAFHERRADENDEKGKRGSKRVVGQDNGTETQDRSDSRSDERLRELQASGHDKKRSRRDSVDGNSVQTEIKEQIEITDIIELYEDSSSSIILPKKGALNNIEKINYKYKDDDKIEGGLKTKYKSNLEAIKMLKNIEQEGRLASSEEQSILAKYSGWGGMPQVFDEKLSSWANEFNELKNVLTDEEYKSVRASTPNAHYTSKEVINAIYQALNNFGFNKGNILEPSMGVGYFFSQLPESMNKSRLYGVELDDISLRISKQLYQKADIQIKGYQDTEFRNNFFDAAVGNVPFGDYKVFDKEYNKYNFFIHDYFIAKTIDKVRPGGIIAFVTSKGTMDKQDTSVRKYIAERSDLIGAIRLPNNAFKEVANTDVTTDILFLQKRDSINLIQPEWVNIGYNDEGVPMNQYYIENPHMMLGTMVFDEKRKGMFGENSKITALINNDEDFDIEKSLADAVTYFHADINKYNYLETSIEDENSKNKDLTADTNVKNFTFTIINGDIYYRENAAMHFMDLGEKTKERVIQLNEIRNITRNIINGDKIGTEIKRFVTFLHKIYIFF